MTMRAEGAASRRPRAPSRLEPILAAWRGYLERPFASTQLILLSGLGLLAFGVMMATSTTVSASMQAGNHQTMWAQLIKEIEFLLLSLPVFWLAVWVSPRVYRRLAYPALLCGALVLVAVLTPGIGVMINDARRWIMIGPLQFQPSEFVKLAVLLWGADLLARKQHFGTLSRPKHLFIPLIPGFAFVCALVMLEPDLGTTLCFLLILLGLLWTIGTPFRYFALILVMIAGSVAALAVAAPYRLQRLTSFTDPFKHAQGSGYHTVEGLYALASGGVFGVGLGAGTSKYSWVPNANTDYVFAVIGEELGLIGCVVVLALFALFAFTGLRISRRSADPFVRLAAGAATVWITGQAVINIGYVTGLLPVTGIPLPFISAGGTSLIATAIVFGMLVSFARHEPAAVAAARKAAKEQQRTRIERWMRIRVPNPYVAPKRKSRPAAQPAPARVAQPSRPAASRPAASRPAAAGRPAASRSVPLPQRLPQPRPVRPPLRPTGTEGQRRSAR
jgi:cell division protein FtsW